MQEILSDMREDGIQVSNKMRGEEIRGVMKEPIRPSVRTDSKSFSSPKSPQSLSFVFFSTAVGDNNMSLSFPFSLSLFFCLSFSQLCVETFGHL